MAWPARSVSFDRDILSRRVCLGGELHQHGSWVRRVVRFMLIGVNHESAPVAVREGLAISETQLPDATRRLAQFPGIAEGLIVSTCNRVEFLARTHNGTADLRGFVAEWFGCDPARFAPHL